MDGGYIGDKHMVRAKFFYLSHFALNVYRGLGNKRTFYSVGFFFCEITFEPFIYIPAGAYTTKIGGFYKLFGCEIYHKFT